MLDLPQKSFLFTFNQNSKEPLIISIGFGNASRVMILKLNLETNEWTKLQSMHFKQDNIKHYVIDEQLFLIGCTTDTFCAIYKWTGNQFRRQYKLNANFLDKIKNIYFAHGIVIMEDFHRHLSFHSGDDGINMKPGLTRQNSPNVVEYSLYKSPIHKTPFYVEFIFNITSLRINLYDIIVTEIGKDVNETLKLPMNPVERVASLKSFLKNRIAKVQSAQKHVSH